ncbi:MAG: response regulator [Acidobacteriota bacterium]
MKILIIDDEDDIRAISRLALGRVGGMDVTDASSGKDGIEKAVAEAPDAILLDVMMPEQDGPATLLLLKADPRTAGIPVIFLTAKAMASELERLRALGAAGVLTKPFDPMTLAASVRALLGAR